MHKLPEEITSMQSLRNLLLLGPTKFKLDNTILKMDSLKQLWLGCPLNENIIDIVSKMPNLEGLTVSGINLKNYESVKRIAHIKYLQINYIGWSRKEWDKLEVETKKIMSFLPGTKNDFYPSTY
jgi:hypothetical protein